MVNGTQEPKSTFSRLPDWSKLTMRGACFQAGRCAWCSKEQWSEKVGAAGGTEALSGLC